MRMKSYFANSVQEAIEKAREELGSDAMLMSSSKTGPDLKDLGAYEVVFGLPGSPSLLRPAGSRAAASQPSPGPSGSERILRELSDLREQLGNLGRTLARSAASGEPNQFTPELMHVCQQLITAGFSAGLAEEITAAIAPRIETQRPKSIQMIREQRDLFVRDLQDALLKEEIESRFEADASLGSQQGARAAVMLVGPPGGGKTSSLIKLAFQQEALERRSTQILSADIVRVGAADQLEMYARILGTPCETMDCFEALGRALAAPGGRRLTLIDTPGFARAEEVEMRALAEAALASDMEVHLVLPATVAPAYAEQIWKRFAVFEPSRLLLTHADEIESTGGLLEFAMRSGLPLSFIASGQQIPEDLRPARKSELTRSLLPVARAISMAA